jgi:membrane protein DedA with SNARE-associated domain
MPVGRFLFYSTIGTVIWTAALAIAGSVLRSNFAIVDAHVNIMSNIVAGGFVLVMLTRYYRCWVQARP